MKNKIIEMNDLYNIIGSNKLHSCSIEITNTCSFRCNHCYVDKSTKKMMSFDMFKSIIDQLLELKCNSILITGGECTINSDFIKMYMYAKEHGMFVNINTNGFHFSKDVRNTFINYKPDLVEITLYGYNNKTYEEFTHVKNSYDSVIDNINFLSKNGIKFNLKATLTKENYMYLNELRKISDKYNEMFRYDFIIFPKLTEIGKGRNKLSLTPKEIIEVIKADEGDSEHFRVQVNETLKNMHENNRIENVFTCQIARGVIFIDCFGNIKPCTVTDKKYNLCEYSIEDAIDDMQDYFKNMKFVNHSNCQGCYKRKLCRYCPGRFFLENGRYDVKSDFYCELADLLIEEFK